jgi:hypothetical protein
MDGSRAVKLYCTFYGPKWDAHDTVHSQTENVEPRVFVKSSRQKCTFGLRYEPPFSTNEPPQGRCLTASGAWHGIECDRL